ncbi:MAG: adenylate kinase [Thermodesulfovibrionales bacterium]
MNRSAGPASALLLIGPTGSGKTPLGNLIGEQGINGARCLHFDFGARLRAISRMPLPPPLFTATEHAFVREVLEQGALLEDEHFPIAEKILQHFLDAQGFKEHDLLVLNGLPRHRGQARSLKPIVAVRGLIVLDCCADDVCTRIGMNTGGDRTGRTDDEAGMIRRKLAVFRERTEPLIAHYRAEGARVCRISVGACTSVGDMYAEIRSFPFFAEEAP